MKSFFVAEVSVTDLAEPTNPVTQITLTVEGAPNLAFAAEHIGRKLAELGDGHELQRCIELSVQPDGKLTTVDWSPELFFDPSLAQLSRVHPSLALVGQVEFESNLCLQA